MKTLSWFAGDDYYLKYPGSIKDYFNEVGDQLIFTGKFISEAKIHSWAMRCRKNFLSLTNAGFKTFVTPRGFVLERTR